MLVTGGDDKKVNLWTIGAQTKALVRSKTASCKSVLMPCGIPNGCILCPMHQSLQGHQTPVDSVTFDHNEEVVAGGASSGSIKLFDLDQAKGARHDHDDTPAGRGLSH